MTPEPEAAEQPIAASGLSTDEARLRLQHYGPNTLPRPRPIPAWKLAVEQLTHFFALLLWAAAALAAMAGVPPLSLAIVVIVLVNAVFAFVQEYRAGRAAERLRDLIPRRATVIRDGRRTTVEACELVPGDLVDLQPGDKVSADLELVEVHDVEIDVSTFTGESVPERPGRNQVVLAGTYVLAGTALGVVKATGKNTRLAEITELTATPRRPPTPIARELQRLVKVIATVALSVASAFLLVSVALKRPLVDAFVFAVGVAVAMVPEGLLPTITLSLAIAAGRMAQRNALVRELEAVETLGLTTVICTDKTGTLTQNRMSVTQVWTPLGTVHLRGSGYSPEGVAEGPAEALEAARLAALAGARCSDGFAVLRDGEWIPQGDPTEVALWVAARRLGVDPEAEACRDPTIRRYPFDATRRRMSVATKTYLYTKGAPDSVIPRCSEPRQKLESARASSELMAEKGLRLIAVARRAAAGMDMTANPDSIESELELMGVFGIADPPREEARQAVASCRSAGIRVVMVTGDHPRTALAVAREVGLAGKNTPVHLGDELPEDEVELGEVVDVDGAVLARVSPEQKLRIARALRSRGHVVAMTGDGVNDAPALSAADVGVAMGRAGTDVAREAADVVLLDDNFATVVAAVELGRSTFSNIRKFLTFHLTDNVAQLFPFLVWALSGARVPLALGVLQILALDIGTDALPAIALGVEHPAPDTMRRPPPRKHMASASVLFRAFAALGATEAGVEMLAFFSVLRWGGWTFASGLPDAALTARASGAAFAAVVFGQLANALACRSSTTPPWKLGLASNPALVAAVSVSLILMLGLLAPLPTARLLGHAAPPLPGWAVALLAAPAVLAADYVYKVVWEAGKGESGQGLAARPTP